MNPATREELSQETMIVYGILNKMTGKWYIGQTLKTFNTRYVGGQFWRFPSNPYLAKTYARYGKKSFEVYLLAKNVSSKSLLDKAEKTLIAQYRSVYPEGYNFESGGQRYGKKVSEASKRKMSETWLAKKAKRRVLYDASEKRHVFTNISTFAKRHGLDSRILHALVSGKLKRYHGWHKKGVILDRPFRASKRYRILSPDGKTHVFYNASRFAREHGLLDVCHRKVLNGTQLNHRGYELKGTRKPKPRNWVGNPNNPKRKYASIILEKDGRRYDVENVESFCRGRCIPKRGVYVLTSGEQKSCHGYRLIGLTPL